MIDSNDTDDVWWFYPLQYGDMLANHEWVPLYIKRLLASDFVAHALAEGRRGDVCDALLLWAASFDQNPAGTLPDDDVVLARLAGYGTDIEGWRAARPGALWGWRPTIIQDGEGKGDRLGHPVIADIAEDMHKRRKGRDHSREEGLRAQHRTRVKAKLVAMKMSHLAENNHVVTEVAEWLRNAKLYITDDNVRVALEVVAGVPKIVPIERNAVR